MSGPCPRTITITIHNGNISAYPSSANIDSVCQETRWNLVTDGSGDYTDDPITFPWPVPPTVPPPSCGTYSQWKGTVEQTGPKQYKGDARERLLPGARPLCYKYDVNWTKDGQPQVFDPDIKNDPYPPGGMGEGEGHGRGHGHGKP